MKFHDAIWKIDRTLQKEGQGRKKKIHIIKSVRWTPLAHIVIPPQKLTMHCDALAHHRSISIERTELWFIMNSCASTRSQRMLSLKRLLEILSFHCCQVDSYLLAHSSHPLHQTSPRWLPLPSSSQSTAASMVKSHSLAQMWSDSYFIYLKLGSPGTQGNFIHSSLILG